VITQYIHSEELGVLIGLTHDLHGRLIIEGRVPVFQILSEAMYGMKLTGAMLESFVGELGNMIAGNMSTRLAEQGAHVEISPPTLLHLYPNIIYTYNNYGSPTQAGQLCMKCE